MATSGKMMALSASPTGFRRARGIAGVDTAGIAANAQEPVDRSVVESNYFEIIPSVKRTTIESELGPFSISNSQALSSSSRCIPHD